MSEFDDETLAYLEKVCLAWYMITQGATDEAIAGVTEMPLVWVVGLREARQIATN